MIVGLLKDHQSPIFHGILTPPRAVVRPEAITPMPIRATSFTEMRAEGLAFFKSSTLWNTIGTTCPPWGESTVSDHKLRWQHMFPWASQDCQEPSFACIFAWLQSDVSVLTLSPPEVSRGSEQYQIPSILTGFIWMPNPVLLGTLSCLSGLSPPKSVDYVDNSSTLIVLVVGYEIKLVTKTSIIHKKHSETFFLKKKHIKFVDTLNSTKKQGERRLNLIFTTKRGGGSKHLILNNTIRANSECVRWLMMFRSIVHFRYKSKPPPWINWELLYKISIYIYQIILLLFVSGALNLLTDKSSKTPATPSQIF